MNAPGLATFQPSFVRLLGWLISLGPVLACVPGESGRPPSGDGPPTGGDDEYARQRASMVDRQLHARDIDDPQVLEVMARVPRHEFVPADYRDLAYADRPLPIEKNQTISQPYIVALMTQLARPQPGDRALDVGTGSGYQAAVLAELVDEVYSIEIHEELADSARARLARLGYRNVEVRHGDGYRGWPEAAPFDLIIVAASPPEIPRPLIKQLAPGGRLILPVGEGFGQELVRIEKAEDGTITRESIAPVSFVPMTGEARHDTDQDR